MIPRSSRARAAAERVFPSAPSEVHDHQVRIARSILDKAAEDAGIVLPGGILIARLSGAIRVDFGDFWLVTDAGDFGSWSLWRGQERIGRPLRSAAEALDAARRHHWLS